MAVLAAALALAGCSGGDPNGDLLVRADRLFDGEQMIEPGAVLIRDDEIVAVGAKDAEGERTIDLGDATILPGFIDLHVHVPPVRSMVRGGVTTVRNVGAPLPALGPPFRYRGLRFLMAGPIVTVPQGYPIPVWGREIGLPVRGAADARRAVAMLARRGAAVIKIALEPRYGPMLSVAEIRSIVAEAHEHELLVTAHVSAHASTIRAVEGGVDELAQRPCGGIGDGILRSVVEAEIEVVATLTVRAGFGDVCGSSAERFVALGGTLLYGTDAPLARTKGIDVRELRLLRRAGLTPEQALAAGTSLAGKQVGIERLGTLRDGAPADVIAVPGDARELRDDLARPLLVIAGGRVVHARRR